MALRLHEHWLWDFWFAQDGEDVHVFYLQAPRSLGDPELRHHNASIGHAVSHDLRTWRVLGTALEPGPPGEFDDLATWTGSVLRHDGRWNLFYTGISRSEQGAVQRVGLATSDDLTSWERRGLLLVADRRWYEPADWRDPWVEWDPESERFHMLVTASANRGPSDGRGVIGHAVSRDLRRWEARAPLSQPGEFSMLEVPQLVHLGGAWRILFCTTRDAHAAARLGRTGVVAQTGTHYLTGDARFGRYALDRDDFLVGDASGSHYAGRVLRHAGAWQFVAWRMHRADGAFAGELSDPMQVRTAPDGSLAVDVRREPYCL